MVIRSRFHGCDIRTCVGESKMSYNLVNIGLLTQGDSFVDKISSNTYTVHGSVRTDADQGPD